MKNFLSIALMVGSLPLLAMDKHVPSSKMTCEGNQCQYYMGMFNKGQTDSGPFSTFAKAAALCKLAGGDTRGYKLKYSFYQETDRDWGSADIDCPCSEEGVKRVLKSWEQPFSKEQTSFHGDGSFWCISQTPFFGVREPREEIVTIFKIDNNK